MDLAHKGGKYEQFGQNEGRLATPETTAAVDKLTLDKYYYLDASVYNKAWADGVYKFIQLGEGVLVKSVPPIEKVFYDKTYQ